MSDREMRVNLGEYLDEPAKSITNITDFVLGGESLQMDGVFITLLIEASVIDKAGTEEQKSGFAKKAVELLKVIQTESGPALRLSKALSALYLFLSTTSPEGEGGGTISDKAILIKDSGDDFSYSLVDA